MKYTVKQGANRGRTIDSVTLYTVARSMTGTMRTASATCKRFADNRLRVRVAGVDFDLTCIDKVHEGALYRVADTQHKDFVFVDYGKNNLQIIRDGSIIDSVPLARVK